MNHIPINPLKLKNMKELEVYIPEAFLTWYHDLAKAPSDVIPEGEAPEESVTEDDESDSE